MNENLPFCAFYIGTPGLTQKLKVSKCVCRSPLAVVEAASSLFAIFGSARGQIYGKKAKKYFKKSIDVCPFWAFYIYFLSLTAKMVVCVWETNVGACHYMPEAGVGR